MFTFIHISVFSFLSCCYGVNDVLMSVFQMELNDYPHFFFTEYERLCSTSQNRSGFPRVLYNALLRLGYDGDTPIYQCQLSWSGFVIGSKPNTGVEVMAHIALTSLCEDRLTATAALHIALLSIQNQENPVW
jgi:hypothetical protein